MKFILPYERRRMRKILIQSTMQTLFSYSVLIYFRGRSNPEVSDFHLHIFFTVLGIISFAFSMTCKGLSLEIKY